MLEIQRILKNKAEVIEGLSKRNIPDLDSSINTIIRLNEERKNIQKDRDNLQWQAKTLTQKIQSCLKTNKKERIGGIKSEITEVKAKIKALEKKLAHVSDQLKTQLLVLPNVPNPKVIKGKSEADNEILEEKTYPLSKISKRQAHWDIIKKYDIIDFELGSKVSGAGFTFYKNKGARLQRALINFFLDQAIESGYVEMQAPILVNKDSAFATGQLPDKEGQMYFIQNDDLYCIPTAEVPLTNMYRDKILKNSELPIKIVGYTPCFRREAGSWGAHVRGLNRLHQFDKVEIIQIVEPEKSYHVLEDMIEHVRQLLDKLQLSYRISRLCSGDLGFTSALTYDFEVYAAGQNRWLEVSSVSNFETFQANRLHLRTKEKNTPKLLHTLNGSALALSRIVAALLENNQNENGIFIPKILQSYCNFQYID